MSERLFGIAASQWAAVSIYHSHVLPSESFDDGYDFYDDFEGPTRVMCVRGNKTFVFGKIAMYLEYIYCQKFKPLLRIGPSFISSLFYI